MPYAPVLNPFVPQALEQGFSSFGRALDRQQAMQQQQAQFDAALAERARVADLGYYTQSEGNRLQEEQMNRLLPTNWSPRTTITIDPTGRRVVEAETAPFRRTVDVVEPALPEPALGSDPTGSGNFYWSGSSLVQKSNNSKVSGDLIPTAIPGLFVNPNNGQTVTAPEQAGAGKPSEADVAFDSNLAIALEQLKELEEVVTSKGNWENRYGDPKAVARLKSLPYNLAILSAKVVDPGSVAREGEVAAAQKYTIPLGFGTTNAETLAAIADRRKLFEKYREERKKAKGGAGEPTVQGLANPPASLSPTTGTASGGAPPLPSPAKETPQEIAARVRAAGGNKADLRKALTNAGYAID